MQISLFCRAFVAYIRQPGDVRPCMAAGDRKGRPYTETSVQP